LEDRAVPSSTILTSVPNPASQGQVVTLTAVVNQTGTDNVHPGTGSPVRGTVTFFDGSTPLAVVTVTPSSVLQTQGMAVFVTPTATPSQISRVTFDGFYTAYGLAFNNAAIYFFGVSDYLNVISTVSDSPLQQLIQVYYTTFPIDYFLLVS
jgi:hypothetical protein